MVVKHSIKSNQFRGIVSNTGLSKTGLTRNGCNCVWFGNHTALLCMWCVQGSIYIYGPRGWYRYTCWFIFSTTTIFAVRLEEMRIRIRYLLPMSWFNDWYAVKTHGIRIAWVPSWYEWPEVQVYFLVLIILSLMAASAWDCGSLYIGTRPCQYYHKLGHPDKATTTLWEAMSDKTTALWKAKSYITMT